MTQTIKYYRLGEYSADFSKLLKDRIRLEARKAKIEKEYLEDIAAFANRRANRLARHAKDELKIDAAIADKCQHLNIKQKTSYYEGSYYDRELWVTHQHCADCGKFISENNETGSYG